MIRTNFVVMRAVSLIFFFLFIALGKTLAYTQPIDTSTVSRIKIDRIYVVGNKKTEEDIILREVSVKEGEEYNRLLLDEQIKKDRNLIYNTNLFDKVTIQILEKSAEEVDLVVQVEERWYIYPAPIFRIADRNLMDWLINRGGRLNRFNYGLKLDHYNFRGRAERLRFVGQLGFERRFFLRYSVPYIEKTQKHGIKFDVGYNERENMAYTTDDHIQQFIDIDEITRRTFSSTITHSYRPSFYAFHFSSIGFSHATVSDTIVSLNPNFLGNGRDLIRNFRLDYTFIHDRRDNRNYPKKGHYFRASGSKIGLGVYEDINISSIQIQYSKYKPLGSNFYLANSVTGFTSFPRRQPYFFYSGLGFDDIFVRGYELNVVEGYQYLLSKNSFRKLLFDREQDISRFMPIDQFSRVPLTFYAKFFFDAAYVSNYPSYEINERLTNTLIYSAGIGIDFVTIYDLVLRFEYSYNSEKNLNFAINVKADI